MYTYIYECFSFYSILFISLYFLTLWALFLSGECADGKTLSSEKSVFHAQKPNNRNLQSPSIKQLSFTWYNLNSFYSNNPI